MSKIILGCLGISFAIIAAGIGLFCFWLFRELPLLDASLSVPSSATIDTALAMVVKTTNPHEKPVTLHSIDVDDSFLEGFQVIGIQPEPSETMHIFGQRSWSFGQSVAPGEILEIQFELKAVQHGHFSGDVDVCNPSQDFKTLVADVVVRDSRSP